MLGLNTADVCIIYKLIPVLRQSAQRLQAVLTWQGVPPFRP